jgi:hypothetical protein
MSFRNVSKVRQRLAALQKNTDEYAKRLNELLTTSAWTDLSGFLKQLREIQNFPVIRPSDVFQSKEWLATQTPQARMNALLGVPAGTPAGAGLSTGPTTTLPGRQGPAWGEAMSPQESLRQRGIVGAPTVNLQEANAFADALEATVKRFEAGFPNSYFTAVVLAMEIPYLRIGARSAAEARLYIQGFAPAFLPGFQQALTEPGLSPLERQLTGEAISILQTGSVTGGGGGGGAARRITAPAPAEQPPPRQVSAGISGGGGAVGTLGAGAGAVGAGAAAAVGGLAAAITGLGATVTRHTEAQANRVLAGVSQQTAEIRSTVNAQSATLRTIQQNSVQANRELAEGFRQLRPISENVTALRKAQESNVQANRELAMALGRFEFSGALSSTAQ